MSVSVDAQGWTHVTPSADSRLVYVSSSSGSDTNTGLSPDQPLKTIQAGYALLRSGYPDELLLKAGDTWNESLGQVMSGTPFWLKSGRSADEPLLISSYGTGARPLIQTTGQQMGMNVTGTVSHVALLGIHLSNDSGGASGFRLFGAGTDWLIENCVIDGFYGNVLLQHDWRISQDVSNIRIRRSAILDAYSGAGTGRPQGIFASNVDGLTLEGNVIDHNGWKDTIDPPTVYCHNAYLDGINNLTVIGNLMSNASNFGLLVRSEGTGGAANPDIENNVFIGDANGISLGTNSNASSYQYAVSNATVRGNVFTELGRSINGAEQSYGIELASTDGALISNNLYLNKPDGGTSFLVDMLATVGYNNIKIQNNTAYNWKGSDFWLGAGPFTNVQITGNTIQDPTYGSAMQIVNSPLPNPQVQYANNTYWSSRAPSSWFTVQGVAMSLAQWQAASGEQGAQAQQVAFPDATRTVETYTASLGGPATVDAYIAGARQFITDGGNAGFSPEALRTYLLAGYTNQTTTTTTAVPPVTVPEGTPGPDTVPPTAAATAAGVTAPGSGTYTFTVNYRDNVGIDAATLDGNDVQVTGPHGFAAAAKLVSMSSSGAGAVTATYSIAVPGGAWASVNNGMYDVVVQAGQVKDTSGNAVAAGTAGSFTVNVPAPGRAQATAVEIGPVTAKSKYATTGTVATDQPMYYRLEVGDGGVKLLSRLTSMKSRMVLELLDSVGNAISGSRVAGLGMLAVQRSLQAGTYYLRLTPATNSGTSYALSVQGLPAPQIGTAGIKTAGAKKAHLASAARVKRLADEMLLRGLKNRYRV